MTITATIKNRNYATCEIEAVVEHLINKGDTEEAAFALVEKMRHCFKFYQSELETPYGGDSAHFLNAINKCNDMLENRLGRDRIAVDAFNLG